MNLSKQEFLNVGESAKYIQDKRKLRAELDMEMEKFLANGGVVHSVNRAESDLPVKPKMFSQPKQRARQIEDQASIIDVKKIAEWCKAHKGRGKELCKELKVAHAFISQITNQTRPCSKQRYTEIVSAMAVVEMKERKA